VDEATRQDDPSDTVELPQYVDEICDRFEAAWRAGERPHLEDHLGAVAASDRAALLRYLLAVELSYRNRLGEPPQAAEYRSRFPGDAGVIEAAFAVAGQYPKGPRAAEWPEVAGYEVLDLLGRGGMGVVYKARQCSLDRLVALKFLPEACARDPAWLARFRREARTASALNHPHICTIYDTGESAGRPYLSMEWVEGQTLETLAGRRPRVEEWARWLARVAGALATAHAAGVVHRDIKPANLMVRDDGIVKVLDFGLARRLPAHGARDSGAGDTITDPGTPVGTPLYMSPEQTRAEPVDAATDIFSLGLVLYELATGQHPFRTGTWVGALHAIIAQAPVPPARLNPEIPAPLEALIQQMLDKDPRLRPTAAEVEAALTRWTKPIPGGRARQQPGAERPPIVGRQPERAALRTAFEEAAAGRGLLVCVSGEPGLGKTTLVESFLDELAASGRAWSLARGRCSERLAGAEAYLPFLEALDSLLQGDGGASLARAMKLLAPAWFVQLAPLAAADTSLAAVLADAKAASQERRKRELHALLHELSRRQPVVVFLDDIHWADPSTVDLLAYLGTRCAGLRLLLVLTYRPSDLWGGQHPFGPLKLELQGRGVCREIALPFLSRDDCDGYLALAFAGHRFPPELAAVLHARTEGNPLFMVDLLRYLRDCGAIVQDQDHGRWALVRAVPDLQREFPESVRSMIQRKIDHLSTSDRQLLMAASVQGPEFDSAVVAELLSREPAEVEESLEILERVHSLVRLVREQAFPDGRLTLRYGFVHVLYQNALYAALLPTRKAAWSAAAARALLDHYGEKSAGLAAELAMLFEAGRDFERAADYYQAAAENAARIYAHHEAAALARRGLALLPKLPDTPERVRRELPLQVTLGVQLQVAQGYATPEAEGVYARARALCEQVQEAPPLFRVLWGLWMFYFVRLELRKSLDLAEQLLTLAQSDQDPDQLLQARQALVVSFLGLGSPAAAREHMELGMALYDSKRHGSHTGLYGQDPGVTCLAFGAVALWLLGYPDQAVGRSREAIALSRELGQPSSLALALYFGAVLQQYRRDGPRVQESAEAIMAVAKEHEFSFWFATGQTMQGWALVEQGKWARGMALLRRGVSKFAATGGTTHRTYHLAGLAEAMGRAGQIEEGLRVLAEALAQVHATSEGFHGAELYRLQGELLLCREPGEVACREAETCFRRALALARQQQARSLELRAAMSLTRLYRKEGRPAEARPILAECYAWFTEGFETPDLKEAKALLEPVGSRSEIGAVPPGAGS
jgi:predicted ATPase